MPDSSGDGGGGADALLRADWQRAKDAEAQQQRKAHRQLQEQLRGIPAEFLKQYRDEHGTKVEGKPAGLNVQLHGIEEDMARNALQQLDKVVRKLRKARYRWAWFLWRRWSPRAALRSTRSYGWASGLTGSASGGG